MTMERHEKIIKISLIGVAVNAGLAAVKILVGIATQSIAISNDGINDLTDTCSSLLTAAGTKLSVRRPDRKHPFGYGRVEYLTSLVVAFLIGVVGVLAFRGAIATIVGGIRAHYGALDLILLTVALLVKLCLGFFLRAMGKKTDSIALIGSGTDALADGSITSCTIVSALLNLFFGLHIESYLAIVVSVFILKAGVELLAESLNPIIGERESTEVMKELRGEVMQHPEVLGVYDIILNNYGHGKKIGSLHIEVDDDMTAAQIHRLTRRVTEEIFAKYGILLTIGIYASNTRDPEAARLFDTILNVCRKQEGIVQVHGFFADWERKCVSFDMVTDFRSDGQKLRAEVLKELKESCPALRFDVALDVDFG